MMAVLPPARVAWALLVAAAALGAPGPSAAQIAVRGDTVHTMAGPPLADGVVLIRDGLIEDVGPAASVRIPPDYKVLTARVVTPGLVDAHTVVGLAGYLNAPHDQMQLDRSSAVQPELRAIDAYDAREELIVWLRQHGVTTIHTGHAPGALVSGGTMIAKTAGTTAEEAVLVPEAMLAVTLGQNGLAEGGRSPGTRAKALAVLRQELVRAREFVERGAQPSEQGAEAGSRDLKREAFARVIRRETPLLVTAHRAHDIVSALRLAREFNLRIVLDGAAEAYLLLAELKKAGVPVILHPTMWRAGGETENLSMETAARLREAGIPFSLQSGYESYVPKTRVVLFEAAVAAAHGLPFDAALAAVTIDAARLLGVEARVGSLERGKDADLALFDGDPFEYTSHVTGVLINGAPVSDVTR